MRYRLLEHTADAMVEAYGKSLGEKFANAAYAMFDQITDIKKVEPRGELKVVLSGPSREQLLVDFLQELLFLHDTEDLLFCEFDVRTDGGTLEASVRGEKYDSSRHPKRSLVKGVTYHRLEIDDRNDKVTILFDV
ncbi:MAG: archease [Candidatus Thermoplasmatota archaeon]|nr:archease [Candidatus Thermoplasmatota archaeon]